MKNLRNGSIILAIVVSMLLFIGSIRADTIIQEKNGVFYAWGDNDYGQLGTGGTSDVPESQKVNLAQVAMYPNSPTYDAAGKFVKVSQVDGAIIALDVYGALWTAGHNNVGQLGRGTAVSADSTKFEKVSAKYTMSDFTVTNETIVATIKGRDNEFITFGKSTPIFDSEPNPKEKWMKTLPFGWISNRPVYYKKTDNNVTEAQQFNQYNDFSVRTKLSLDVNQTNPDSTIGHVNSYTLQSYSGGKVTPDRRLQYFFDYENSYLKVIADTKLDVNGYKSELIMNYYDVTGYRTKYFRPTFQKGNNVEQSEWIEDYSAKDGSKKTYMKKYDEDGLVYPYAPEYTANRNAKGGVWTVMEENDYDKFGNKVLHSLSTYDLTDKKTNYREFQYIWLYSPNNGFTTKYSELQYDPSIENKQIRTVANGYSEEVSRLRLSGWEDEIINSANPGNRTTTSKKFYGNGAMSEKYVTYYNTVQKIRAVKTTYDSNGKVTGNSTQFF